MISFVIFSYEQPVWNKSCTNVLYERLNKGIINSLSFFFRSKFLVLKVSEVINIYDMQYLTGAYWILSQKVKNIQAGKKLYILIKNVRISRLSIRLRYPLDLRMYGCSVGCCCGLYS